jgi:cytochrome bd ubiquinol oxidase subunit II
MPIDYGTLRLVWWVLLGVLLIGFAVLDGFDLGTAILHPFVARTDSERRVSLNAVGPVWEGNQVWFILGGGAAFAAWPPLYAASFSGFYLAMFLVLAGLILRPVAITFRSKVTAKTWRQGWDRLFFLSGLVPALIFGVAFGNLFTGVPFHFDNALRLTYAGGLLGLLNPFALLCGLVSVAMLTLQGASWLALKVEGDVAARSRKFGLWAALALLLLFSLAGLWLAYGLDGYVLQSAADPAGPSNPTLKSVGREAGAWLDNYYRENWTLAAPGLAYLGALVAIIGLGFRITLLAFIASSLSVAGVVATAGLSLFPFLFPSSSDPGHSLTVWDSSSSQMTLFIMLIAVVFFLPIILAYTSWVFAILRGTVGEGAIEKETDSFY